MIRQLKRVSIYTVWRYRCYRLLKMVVMGMTLSSSRSFVISKVEEATIISTRRDTFTRYNQHEYMSTILSARSNWRTLQYRLHRRDGGETTSVRTRARCETTKDTTQSTHAKRSDTIRSYASGRRDSTRSDTSTNQGCRFEASAHSFGAPKHQPVQR